MMTRQEKKVQLDALAREIEGHEVALRNWKDDLEDAEAREDEDEVRRLSRNIRESEKTIGIAKGQINILAPEIRTRQEKAHTSESPRIRGRASSKAS
jgi:hypothetical protein